MDEGSVIWITGLSASGKTTLAEALDERMRLEGLHPVLLDGDVLREALSEIVCGFDSLSRKKLAFTYAKLCRLLALQGQIVICSTISLFHDVHDWNRAHQPHYIEVFLDIPESERRRRDPKGLYRGEEEGTLKDMTGKDIPAEFPLSPDLCFSFSEYNTFDIMVEQIFVFFKRKHCPCLHN